jgi:hypothetical protein
MAWQFNLIPRHAARIETRFRRIVTPLPPPAAIPLLETLRKIEPVAMQGQPPVVWDRAEGFQVWDRWGNQWIDWSSGVLVANAGHGRKEIADAVAAPAASHLLTNYCFPSEIRARLLQKLASMLPAPLQKIFLLTTGSETVECAIKLCRGWGGKSGRARQARGGLVPARLPWAHAGRATGGRHSVAQGMDRESGPGFCADFVPRRLADEGNIV